MGLRNIVDDVLNIFVKVHLCRKKIIATGSDTWDLLLFNIKGQQSVFFFFLPHEQIATCNILEVLEFNHIWIWDLTRNEFVLNGCTEDL